VLLVEDEVSDALVVKSSLCRDGTAAERFDVEHATTLADGIVQLDRAFVDVLLLDLRLPDSDGPETVAQLRERDDRVPVVVLTGTDDPDIAARAFEAGADEYLVKDDLQAGLLRRTIRHAIDRRRARAAEASPSPPRNSRGDRSLFLHDLKNLHTSILGNARILQRELPDEGFLRERVDALLGTASTARDLVLKLCAGEDDAAEANGVFELTGLVRESGSLLRAVVPERVELRFDLAADSALVAACADSIRRILLELVVNAVEAIGEADGRLVVRTGHALLASRDISELVEETKLAPGPHAWFEVLDDAGGLDAAARARLFDRGFSTKGGGRGRGLGQVITTLSRHAAGLRVRSRPAEGSSFRVYLPSPR
jgi:signal transduction histidine kinase